MSSGSPVFVENVVGLRATLDYILARLGGTPGGGITELTGAVIAGPGSGSVAAALSATGVAPGIYGDANNVSQITVGADGRLTIAANVPIAGVPPAAHATTHENGGSDEINVAGLSGLLADQQTPLAHETTHRSAGSDPLSVLNLAGFPGGTGTFLRADASFAAPPDTGITQLTGDVTAGPGSGSQAATIPNATITFAKFQDISTDRLLGRDTAGSGDVEEIAVGGGIEFTGAQAIQTSAFTGDVTKAAGGTTLTIAAATVTNAMLANMATQTIKGRNTAGTGDPEDLSVATVQTMLNITTELQLVKMRITAAARM